MMIKRKIVFFLLSFLLGQNVFAQQVTDSIKQGSGPAGFNALNYSLQKRYRKKGDRFGNVRIQDNMFFQLGIGYESISGSDDGKFNGGFRYGASVGKMLSSLHAIRINASYTTNGQFVGQSLYRVGIGVDHLFDISSYLQGYDPNRMLNFSTIEGFGVQFAKYKDNRGTAPEGHLGLQIKISPSPKFDLVFEPFMGIASKNIFADPTTRNIYGLFYGVNMGLRYQIHDQFYVAKPRTSYASEGDFMDLSTGVMMPISDLVGKGLGPMASIGYGRWFLSGVALHIAGTIGTSQWHKADYQSEVEDKIPYTANENTAFMGGRAEVVLDPMGLIKGYEEWEKWKFRVSGGAEFGYMSKSNSDQPINLTYLGPTVAARAGYRIQHDLLLYLEPRFTMAYYAIPYQKVDATAKFTDKLVGVSLGLEFDRPVLKRKMIHDSFRHFFQREWLIQAEGGLNLPIQGIRYQDRSYMDYALGTTVGYMITPSQTPAARLDFSRVNVDQEDGYRQYAVPSLALQYRLNLMNLMQGYRPQRKFEIQAFAGPVLSYRKKATRNRAEDETAVTRQAEAEVPITVEDEVVNDPYQNKLFVGGEVGMNMRYRFLRNFGVFVEPRLRMYGSGFMPSQMNGGMKKLFSVQVGVSYQFTKYKRAKYVE